MIVVEPALESDRPSIERLLVETGLPLDGLDVAFPAAVVARGEGGVIGCAAVEEYGSAGLLRSVCVAPEVRGTGIGRRLVNAAEALAASHGVAELYLLTETAEEWFPRLGYRPTTRGAVPTALTVSVEFASACPESAAVLYKRL